MHWHTHTQHSAMSLTNSGRCLANELQVDWLLCFSLPDQVYSMKVTSLFYIHHLTENDEMETNTEVTSYKYPYNYIQYLV